MLSSASAIPLSKIRGFFTLLTLKVFDVAKIVVTLQPVYLTVSKEQLTK